jgi:glycosyltransferase involved in cell wall biosynthesis
MVQRSLSPPGGGNAVAAWMVHALAGQHDLATLTTSAWSIAQTNTFYGTSIREDSVKTQFVGFPWRTLARLHGDRFTRLRMSALLGKARELSPRYDLMITADNYASFGLPGIQYVHFPARLQPAPARLAAIVHPYFWLCNRVLGADWTDAARNLTLANSRWTAERITQLGELPSPVVLYPPVIDPGGGLPWSDRDDAFLCIGRFHRSKRIELAISIIRKARMQSMPHARLIIVGSAVDAEYTRALYRLAAGEPWVEFRRDLSRTDLNELMGRSRYGIQPMIGEHFGMATAEMTRAGCLVFAHRSGGTPEVLDNESALLWNTEEEAVARIVAMAGSHNAGAVRLRLREQATRFSTETFVERFRDIVAASGELVKHRIAH